MNFNTYILAGGNSTRMKTDKATQLLNGNSFLHHILQSVKFFETTIKLVSSKPEHQYLGYDCVADIEIDKGPVSAIAAALKDSKTAWNLILSCDVPLIKPEVISWLLKNHNTNFDCTVCLIEGRKMPLTAIYNKTCESIFRKNLNEKRLRVMTALEDLNVNYIKVPEAFKHQLTNINTPEQLKRISV